MNARIAFVLSLLVLAGCALSTTRPDAMRAEFWQAREQRMNGWGADPMGKEFWVEREERLRRRGW